eukprot:g9372.t1
MRLIHLQPRDVGLSAGPIPTALGGLAVLKSLALDGNNLSDPAEEVFVKIFDEFDDNNSVFDEFDENNSGF